MVLGNLSGLSVLIDSAFPKSCPTCGRVYKTPEQFLELTQDLPQGRSSLKSAMEDDGFTFVEVFRNCACGSTLMDEFTSRRDNSNTGQRRREKFDELLEKLLARNIPEQVARKAILAAIYGNPDELGQLLQTETNKI